MTPEQIAEQEAATAAAKKKAEEDAAKGITPATPPSDPVKAALDAENKKKRPEIDRATHSLVHTAKRLKELGGDPAKVLGIPVTPPEEEISGEEDDSKPLTVGDYKRIQREQTQQTALQLAEQITNPDERELAKVYLRTKIVPSGNPESDLADAMALVNSVKNKQVADEIHRKITNPVKRHVSGSGNPGGNTETFQPSEEEAMAASLARVKPEDMEKWVTDRREGKQVVFGTAAKKKREAEARR